MWKGIIMLIWQIHVSPNVFFEGLHFDKSVVFYDIFLMSKTLIKLLKYLYFEFVRKIFVVYYKMVV